MWWPPDTFQSTVKLRLFIAIRFGLNLLVCSAATTKDETALPAHVTCCLVSYAEEIYMYNELKRIYMYIIELC